MSVARLPDQPWKAPAPCARCEALNRRLTARQEEARWRRLLHEIPTAELNATEKIVAEDLYAFFKGRGKGGVPSDRPISIRLRARKNGVSPETYGKCLGALADMGTITRNQIRDRDTGHTRVIVAATEQFWDASAFRRDVRRDYSWRERRCPKHPNANVTETRTTTRVTVVLDEIERTWCCSQCGDSWRETERTEVERTKQKLNGGIVHPHESEADPQVVGRVQRTRPKSIGPLLREHGRRDDIRSGGIRPTPVEVLDRIAAMASSRQHAGDEQ